MPKFFFSADLKDAMKAVFDAEDARLLVERLERDGAHHDVLKAAISVMLRKIDFLVTVRGDMHDPPPEQEG